MKEAMRPKIGATSLYKDTICRQRWPGEETIRKAYHGELGIHTAQVFFARKDCTCSPGLNGKFHLVQDLAAVRLEFLLGRQRSPTYCPRGIEGLVLLRL